MVKTTECLLKEMIEKVDIDTFKEILCNTNEKYSRRELEIDWHIKTWAENKLPLYIKMGEVLKLEKEVEYEANETQVRGVIYDLSEKYREQLPYVCAFIESKHVCTAEDFLNNRITGDVTIMGYKFQKGSRLSRALGKLTNNKQALNNFQTELSMAIQSLRGKGRAVLSIDPIDYLTMSTNNSGWRSCHNIVKGEFKAGCISYMCDKSTAIGYVTGNTKATLGDAEFDNKIWRQCVYFSNDISFACQSRQYPGINNNNRRAIFSLVEKAIGESCVKKALSVEDDNKTSRNIMVDKTTLHYNDILRMSFRQYYLITKASEEIESIEEWSIKIAGDNTRICQVGIHAMAVDSTYQEIEDSDSISYEGICHDCGCPVRVCDCGGCDSSDDDDWF